ncbi:DUF262 domain-containing protein [Actinoplanes sp. NPDC023714]|uniref:DUF262 domain-containing protein n=1 Tax=Actinoplanes sp. NPDC023714 TaxID=3154322 RepID=UPI003407C127
MTDPDDGGVVRPDVVLLETLLDDIAAGRLRVPRFQRPFVWSPEQMLELFDSIEGGYPIGSILVWETALKVPSLDTVAGIDIPPPPTDRTVSYLLDGHQRLSTLFGTLVKRPSTDDPQWHIYRRLGDNVGARALRFIHGQPDVEGAPRLLPLQAVLRTMDFLAYARQVTRDPATADQADTLIDEAEHLAQGIKSYKIAVIRLVGGSISHAVEAFTRVNSGGRKIQPYDLVSALTYRVTHHSLADRIEALRQNVAATGFGAPDAGLLFRACLRVGGIDAFPLQPRWAEVAAKLEDRIDDITRRTDVALARTIRFLRYEAGVPHMCLLPEDNQLLRLVATYDGNPELNEEQTADLVQWFWLTAWTGTTWEPLSKRHHSIRANIAKAGFASETESRSLLPQVRPLSERLGSVHSRSRAYLLWELREFSRRLDLSGKPFDATELFIRSGITAYRRIMPTGSQGPANRMMLPEHTAHGLVRELTALPPRLLRDVVASHGIPVPALTRMLGGDAEGFVRERSAYLGSLEEEFMRSMGVEPQPAADSSDDYEA